MSKHVYRGRCGVKRGLTCKACAKERRIGKRVTRQLWRADEREDLLERVREVEATEDYPHVFEDAFQYPRDWRLA